MNIRWVVHHFGSDLFPYFPDILLSTSLIIHICEKYNIPYSTTYFVLSYLHTEQDKGNITKQELIEEFWKYEY